MRVATYNIHSGVGSDGRRSLQRILDVIDSLQADVIALQEVGSLNNHREGKHQFRVLEESGYNLLSGPVGPGYYGNALLTRLPVLENGLQELSYQDREPRGLLHATIQWAGPPADSVKEQEMGDHRKTRQDLSRSFQSAGRSPSAPGYSSESSGACRFVDATSGAAGPAFQVFATHLGLANRERWHQVKQIKNCISNRLNRRQPWLLMGDMNIWFPFSPQFRYLKRSLNLRWHRARTFPSRFPLLSLDRLALSAHWNVIQEGRRLDPLSRKASDHLPFYMDLALSGIPAGP